MAGYLDAFTSGPLAKSSVETPPLAQMQTMPASSMPVQPVEPSLTQQATDMVKDSVMQKGVQMATAPVETAMQTGFDKVVTGIKGAFAPAATTTPGTASLMANQAAMTQAAGLAAPTTTAATTAATGAAGKALASGVGGAAAGGGMAALGAAVPYIGMGLLAGKAFGLFNRGGVVAGPLSGVKYKFNGGEVKEEVNFSFSKGPLSQ